MVYAVLTAFTLVAFAANSLLCRMALGANLIDPVSFSTLRLLSGAFVLVPIAHLTGKPNPAVRGGSWGSASALFIYAFGFSLAYISLDAGIGALVLFGAVQATMIGVGLKSGERPNPVQWLGLGAALAGLVYLVFPGITAPSPRGVALMFIAGIAWGLYSVRGRKSGAPVWSTASNFLRTVPMAAAACILAVASLHTQLPGVLLAVTSGSITSGLGYALWYKALRRLTTTQAAVVQLLVPVLAAIGGVAFLGERLTGRLLASSALILGGVAMAVLNRKPGNR